MSDDVLIAWIGLLGTLLVALLGKISWDTARTRRDTREVHDSINQRVDEDGNPVPLSDRLDDLRRLAEAAAAAAQAAVDQGERHQSELEKQCRDIRGIREDNQNTRREVGLLHAEDRAMRRDFIAHIEAEAEWGQQIADLHARYGHTRPKPAAEN